jgi:hypothetical protein
VHTLTVSARDAAGNVAVSVALTVTVNNSTEFAMGPTPGSPTSLAVVAGGTVTFKLNVAPTAGFAGPISFTCTGAPQFSTCAISPNPANVSGTTPTQITVTVTTTAKSSRTPSPLASGVPPTRRIAFAWATLFLPGIVFLRGAKLRRRGAPLLVAMVLVLSILFGCGGGSGPQIIIDDFTRLGTYPITITASISP